MVLGALWGAHEAAVLAGGLCVAGVVCGRRGVWWLGGGGCGAAALPSVAPGVCGGGCGGRAAVWLVLGGVLLSHTLAGAVPSALGVLASGFGMGPGVAPPL